MKVRCIRDRDNAWVRAGSVHEVERKDSYGWVMLVGGPCWFPMAWFEPVTDEPDKDLLNLAFPCPRVDQYAEHRLREGAMMAAEMEAADHDSGATARLLRGLESEKVRERVKAFPHPARNPR